MNLNLLLAFFWVFIAIVLLAIKVSGRGDLLGDGPNLNIGLVLAGLLTAYNLVRWWASRMNRRPPPAPPRRRHVDEPPPEYNPALDFTRPDPPK